MDGTQNSEVWHNGTKYGTFLILPEYQGLYVEWAPDGFCVKGLVLGSC